jgi:hypothetical protein
MPDLRHKLTEIRDELQLLGSKTSLTESDETRVQVLQDKEREVRAVLHALGEKIDGPVQHLFYR